MKIVDIRTTALRSPLHSPFVTALRHTDHLETVVVEVIDGDGEHGFGEAPQVWRVTGESLAGARACIDGPLAEVVRGQDADELHMLSSSVSRAVVGNFGAKAAVETALYDLAARRLGVSLPRYLGTNVRRVESDATLSAGAAHELPATAKLRIDDGFRVLKLKVGTDASSDLERIRAVREAVGPDVRIRVDANQGWTPREAVRVISATEDSGLEVELVEQPVAADDLDGLAWVTDHVATPVLADESVFGLRDLMLLIERRAADLVNIKLAKCGGLSAAGTMHALASANGVGVLVGTMLEGPIGVGAAASFAAAYGTALVADLDAAWWLEESPVAGGLSYDGAVVDLPDRPGLGIDGLRGHAR